MWSRLNLPRIIKWPTFFADAALTLRERSAEQLSASKRGLFFVELVSTDYILK
jgi:hypothetical protein